MNNILRNISVLGIWVMLMCIGLPANAQKSNKNTVITDSVYVHGVCSMCKDRIENAALIKGVKKVNWDKKTNQLIIFYKPSKVSMDKIEQEIAKVGHDTENYRAEDKIYNRLPDCCAYRSGEIEIH